MSHYFQRLLNRQTAPLSPTSDTKPSILQPDTGILQKQPAEQELFDPFEEVVEERNSEETSSSLSVEKSQRSPISTQSKPEPLYNERQHKLSLGPNLSIPERREDIPLAPADAVNTLSLESDRPHLHRLDGLYEGEASSLKVIVPDTKDESIPQPATRIEVQQETSVQENNIHTEKVVQLTPVTPKLSRPDYQEKVVQEIIDSAVLPKQNSNEESVAPSKLMPSPTEPAPTEQKQPIPRVPQVTIGKVTIDIITPPTQPNATPRVVRAPVRPPAPQPSGELSSNLRFGLGQL